MTAALDDRSGPSPTLTGGSLAVLARKYRALFAIDPREASFAARGFPAGAEPARRRLEQVGETFLVGFNHGLVADDAEALQRAVAQVAPDRRGFAVEGAAMGAAIADALMLGGRKLDAWMACSEADYTYLAHVGAGWALARVPWRRRAILRGRDAVHGWLVFDGLGFHDAYFTPQRLLRGWRRTSRGYAAHVYDQGVGRALWFVAGGEVERAIAAMARFAPARQADLWSGLGLALAYAGGATPAALSAVMKAAGVFRGSLAQGAAFAAEAHARARHIPPHAHEAVAILTGRDAAAAAELVRDVRSGLPGEPAPAALPAYERWRRHVQSALVQR